MSNRDLIIEKTLAALKKLPDDKLSEVSDFAEFVLSRIEDDDIVNGIAKITSSSQSLSFLNEEETLYTKSDLKQTLH